MNRRAHRFAVRHTWLVATLAIVLVPACSGGGISVPTTTAADVPSTDEVQSTEQVPSTEPAPTTTIDQTALDHLDDVEAPAWKPETRTDELAMTIGAGRPTVQQAIDAFSLTYLPMPGATPTSLPPGEGVGTQTALQLIEAARDQLAPEQLAVLDSLDAGVEAVSAVTDLPDAASTTTVAPAGFRSALRAPVDPTIQQYDALLHRAADDWHKFKPDLPQTPLELVLSNVQIDTADMDALYPAKSIIPDRDELVCRIRVFPLLWNTQQDDDVILTAFAHELFHCAQNVWNTKQQNGFPSWLVEGSASFAAFDLYGTTFPPPDRYTLPASWFTVANKELSARTYPAWALFETFRQYGGDPYAAAKRAFEGGPDALDSTAATDPTAGWLQVAGLDDLLFRVTWSANDLRSTTFPEKEWMMNWPYLSLAGPRDNLTSQGVRGVGTYSVKGSKAFSQQQVTVTMGPKVGLILVLANDGPLLTHATNGTVAIAEGDTRKLCFDESGCKCPNGLTAGAQQMAGRDMVFSFAAQELQGTADVIAVPWDATKFCAEQQKKTGEQNGDPHLRSFDGQAFDVMAPGEFVAARDDRGGFEVQVRNQVMNGHGTGTSVVALGTGTHRIVFGGDLAAPGATTLAVDGTTADGSAPIDVGDVTVEPSDNHNWTVTWPDGSFVTLHWNHGWFVSVALDEARAPHVTGLLGTPNDDMRDDLTLTDGSHVDPGDRQAVDGDFAPLWYVQQATSLFDYRPGETTLTFRVTPPPPPSIDADVVSSCTAGMPASATKAELGACAYDVAVTGDDSFVGVYSQVVTDRASADPVAFGLNVLIDKPAEGPAASGSSVTLEGTLARDTFGAAGVVDAFTATLEVSEGSIILGQVQLCAPGRDITMRATLRGTADYNEVHLCDPIGFNQPFHETDEVVPGEGALWASAAGTYDIRVVTDSDEPLVTSVMVSTDPDPAVVDAKTVASTGYGGRLVGRADTVVLLLNTGDQSVTWNVTGIDKVCGDAQYGADPLGGGFVLTIGVCGHTNVVYGPGDVTVPFIIYGHTDDPVDITFLPQPA